MENEYIWEDYVHSANSLFHFMTSSNYLIDALKRKALCPRYCYEDVEYLHIRNGEEDYPEIAVLQKCFCDIPLNNVLKRFPIKLTENNQLTKEELAAIPEKTSHPELYGEYALAFSKRWGEENRLQPVQYLSEDAFCTQNYSKMFNSILLQEDIADEVADTILNWLCFMKPLRGTMKRRGETKSKEKFDYEIFKNFHDEHEWRYVPFNCCIKGKPLDSVIANEDLLSFPDQIRDISDRLEHYEETWIPFKYEDLRYIIVPDDNGRVEIINAIHELDSSGFKDKKVIRVNAKMTSMEGIGIKFQSGEEVKKDEPLALTFLGDLSYTIWGITLKMYGAFFVGNALAKEIIELEEGKYRVIYGDDEANPMFTSYRGYISEEEAKTELATIIDHKGDYENAKTLEQYLDERNEQW